MKVWYLRRETVNTKLFCKQVVVKKIIHDFIVWFLINFIQHDIYPKWKL